MPETNGSDPVSLATAPKRAKHAKEPQVKQPTTTETKTPEVVKSPESSSSECNFQDFHNLESLNRNQSSFAKRQLQDYWCNLSIISYLKTRYFSNQEHSKGTFAMG